jgi:hypothetical protein
MEGVGIGVDHCSRRQKHLSVLFIVQHTQGALRRGLVWSWGHAPGIHDPSLAIDGHSNITVTLNLYNPTNLT